MGRKYASIEILHHGDKRVFICKGKNGAVDVLGEDGEMITNFDEIRLGDPNNEFTDVDDGVLPSEWEKE